MAQPRSVVVNLRRRDFCFGIGLGLGASAAFAVRGLGSADESRELPLRPPGAGHEDEFLAACIRCGRCVNACPMNLIPTRLALAARYNNPSIASQYHIRACVDRGCRSYACPAKLNLLQLIRTGTTLAAANPTRY